MADGEINRNGATIRIDDDGGVQVEPAEGQEVEYTGPDRGTDAIRDSVSTDDLETDTVSSNIDHQGNDVTNVGIVASSTTDGDTFMMERSFGFHFTSTSLGNWESGKTFEFEIDTSANTNVLVRVRLIRGTSQDDLAAAEKSFSMMIEGNELRNITSHDKLLSGIASGDISVEHVSFRTAAVKIDDSINDGTSNWSVVGEVISSRADVEIRNPAFVDGGV